MPTFKLLEYVPLPDGSPDTCDVTNLSYCSNPASDESRCGDIAAFIHRSRCGCGACDMSTRHCLKHQQDYETGTLHTGTIYDRKRSASARELH